MRTTTLAIVVAAAALVPRPGAAPQAADPLGAIQGEVSVAEIERTLHAIDLDRTSGSEGERQAFEYLARKLTEYGVTFTRHEARLFLSWPGRAEIAVPGGPPIAGKTAAFSAATPPGGLAGVLLFDPKMTRGADQSLAFGAEVRGRIPVVRGISDTEALVLGAQRAGALAVMQVDAVDKLHEDIVTTVWGTPTRASAARIPAIPYMIVGKADGDRLRALAGRGPITARLTIETRRGWRTLPMITAEVPGRSADFVLVATHVDAWYRGMTDTAGSVASILDMARVLRKHQGELARGVRFAWWTGHSFGRYAGSAWYTDRYWADLDEHCVAYTNLDGPGRRGSRVDLVAADGWPGMAEYSRAFVERLTGKPAAERRASGRLFRPGRDSDSSYQGIGVPFFSVGVPGPPPGHPDVEPGGRIAYWHAEDDTFDKLDMKALELDTRYRVAQLYDLASMTVLPHRLAPVAASYVAALKNLAAAAGERFDLSRTVAMAAALEGAARRLDEAPRPTGEERVAAFNRLVVALTHRLNSTLYTKAGRFDQDPAAEMPIMPLLAGAKDLAALPPESDEYGFLETELIRGRNAVEATLREATAHIDRYLSPPS